MDVSTILVRVRLTAMVENYFDLMDCKRGYSSPEFVRRVSFNEAIVDQNSVRLSLPDAIVEQLGLDESGRCGSTRLLGPIKLTVYDRECHLDVVRSFDSAIPVFGHSVLTLLDFVIDNSRLRLIGNPAHGGQQMFELY